MIEAALLLIELALFGLVLWAVGRKQPPEATRDLGIFSYRETIDNPPAPSTPTDKATRRA